MTSTLGSGFPTSALLTWGLDPSVLGGRPVHCGTSTPVVTS